MKTRTYVELKIERMIKSVDDLKQVEMAASYIRNARIHLKLSEFWSYPFHMQLKAKVAELKKT